MFERFNESARRAIFFARYEASRLGERIIESRHILLGLLREDDAVTTELWRTFGVEPREIQAKYPTVEAGVSSSAEMPLSEDGRKILAYAVHEADTREDREVTPCHLVLAILRVPESEAARMLHERDLDYELVSEIANVLLQHAKRQAEIEERTPITLRLSHYELLDRVAEGANLGESRPVNRQSLVLAVMDAVADSGVCEQKFSSLEDFRTRIRRALSGEGTG